MVPISELVLGRRSKGLDWGFFLQNSCEPESEKTLKGVLQNCLVVLTCSACAILSLSCEDSPTAAGQSKDPRTYTWTIDTLAYPGSFETRMQQIWGSSPHDVYVVGHNDQAFGKMWHFDGNKWADVKLSTAQGGTIGGSIDLAALLGFASNDVWAVGERIHSNYQPPPNFFDSSLVIHYDGVRWTEATFPPRGPLMSVWGTSDLDLWAGGEDGVIHHFNGSTWSERLLDSSFAGLKYPLQITSIAGFSSNDVYAAVYKPDQSPPVDSTVVYLYHFNGHQWTKTDSTLESIGSSLAFGTILYAVESALYTAGGLVSRKEGNRWVRILDDDYVARIGGNRMNNLFAVGGEERVYHYNGADWKRYEQFKDPIVFNVGVWTDGAEVFVIGTTFNSPSKTLVLHGK
jgi:hypothetical protein